MLPTAKFSPLATSPLATSTNIFIPEEVIPETPNMFRSILLYTIALSGPVMLSGIEPDEELGLPAVNNGKIPLSGVPGTNWNSTFSTYGQCAIKPLTDGSKPETSKKISPFTLLNTIPETLCS